MRRKGPDRKSWASVLAAALVVALAAAGVASAEDPPAARTGSGWRSGEEVYEKVCSLCHDTGVSPVIRGRNLPPIFVTVFVRKGNRAMPGGSLWFAPVSQARGSETLKQMELTKRILAKHGLDYNGEFIVGMRDMHHIVDMLFDKTDPAMTQAAYACFDELITTFSAEGYGTYRVNTAFMDKVAGTYGPVQRRVHQTLKAALDPNGILAPGKSGIRLERGGKEPT